MTPTRLDEVAKMKNCDTCGGEGWVCEKHPGKKWGYGDGCCGGAGMPCECRAIFGASSTPTRQELARELVEKWTDHTDRDTLVLAKDETKLESLITAALRAERDRAMAEIRGCAHCRCSCTDCGPCGEQP